MSESVPPNQRKLLSPLNKTYLDVGTLDHHGICWTNLDGQGTKAPLIGELLS